jgi:mono/diheme cytochrome c family protein
MAIVFILFWIVLGLGVFFVAMRGGPRGARESLHTGSRAGQRFVVLGIVVAFAFGLIVPTLILFHNGEHKAGEAVGGLRLNGEQQKGRELFAHSCAVCHTLAAVKAVGRTGPSLDVRVGDDIATAAGRKALVLNAIAEGRARGLGPMPRAVRFGQTSIAPGDGHRLGSR